MQQRFQFKAEAQVEGGVYANIVSVWHSPHEFTLDFAATLPAQVGKTDGGEDVTVVPCRVTARVKVPPTVMFDLIRAMNTNLTNFEATYGEVRRPGQDNSPLLPPDDMRPDEGGAPDA